MNPERETEASSGHKLPKIGWIVGITLFLLMLQVPAPEGLSADAWCVAALGILMAVMWVTEAIPLPATALLPIPLVPLLGVSSVKETVVSYSHPVIFLFMGGFIVALAMERWKLHQRIALFVLQLSGDRPAFLVGGFLSVSAFLSMWVSNTATTLMMLPIAVSVIGTLKSNRGDGVQGDSLAKALMLSLAYGGICWRNGNFSWYATQRIFRRFRQTNIRDRSGFFRLDGSRVTSFSADANHGMVIVD